MNLKLKKISIKSFILIFASINVVAGFLLGLLVTIISLVAPEEQGASLGVWAIILFPILNGILGVVTGAIFTGMFNFFASKFGGLELEFESLP